ncbi:MAG: nucleotide exchange factor GrpE [Phycicoccus sp.]
MTERPDAGEPREKLAPVPSDDVWSRRDDEAPAAVAEDGRDAPGHEPTRRGTGADEGSGRGGAESMDESEVVVSGDSEATAAAAVVVDDVSVGGADLAAERLADLQRLQAEYVNYKRRVDRDRTVVQERVVHDVLESLLPVLDDIHAAREHGDLAGGPFAAIADKLESTLGRYGLARFGSVGAEFDPSRHEALMHAPWPTDGSELPAEASTTTVVTVLQPGYRAGDQVLRPARVAVADPP